MTLVAVLFLFRALGTTIFLSRATAYVRGLHARACFGCTGGGSLSQLVAIHERLTLPTLGLADRLLVLLMSKWYCRRRPLRPLLVPLHVLCLGVRCRVAWLVGILKAHLARCELPLLAGAVGVGHLAAYGRRGATLDTPSCDTRSVQLGQTCMRSGVCCTAAW